MKSFITFALALGFAVLAFALSASAEPPTFDTPYYYVANSRDSDPGTPYGYDFTFSSKYSGDYSFTYNEELAASYSRYVSLQGLQYPNACIIFYNVSDGTVSCFYNYRNASWFSWATPTLEENGIISFTEYCRWSSLQSLHTGENPSFTWSASSMNGAKQNIQLIGSASDSYQYSLWYTNANTSRAILLSAVSQTTFPPSDPSFSGFWSTDSGVLALHYRPYDKLAEYTNAIKVKIFDSESGKEVFSPQNYAISAGNNTFTVSPVLKYFDPSTRAFNVDLDNIYSWSFAELQSKAGLSQNVSYTSKAYNTTSSGSQEVFAEISFIMTSENTAFNGIGGVGSAVKAFGAGASHIVNGTDVDTGQAVSDPSYNFGYSMTVPEEPEISIDTSGISSDERVFENQLPAMTFIRHIFDLSLDTAGLTAIFSSLALMAVASWFFLGRR